ncbi:MAG: glycerophosphodiester phosphodiesterase family protein, partial [Rubrobacter sp.]
MNGVRDQGLLCLLGVSLALAALAFLAGTPAQAQALGERPVNLAHRGASASAPENTFAAFDRAISDGADALEIDVRLSADGRLLVIHDETVDRTTDGSSEVGSLSLDEISGLDAGYRFAPDDGHPYRDRGLSVPTLAETLGRYPEVPFNIEI